MLFDRGHAVLECAEALLEPRQIRLLTAPLSLGIAPHSLAVCLTDRISLVRLALPLCDVVLELDVHHALGLGCGRRLVSQEPFGLGVDRAALGVCEMVCH